MGEQLIKPYEISIWEGQIVGQGENSYYKESKIATIGSDTMSAPNRVYSPVFKKKVNGEKTLTFSLAYKYYDDEVGDFVVNPFVKYLINERIVKLKYDNKWYEFVIKECEEDSESYEFTYTASDAYIQELSKTGYNVTFNTEINNNLGTVTELGEYVLKNTDWKVDKENSDILQQKVSEPIYACTVLSEGLRVLDIDNNVEVDIAKDEVIWIFYSYIANRTVDYVQFLRNSDIDKWIYDDNNAIIGPNYRIMSPVEYFDGEDVIWIYVDGVQIRVESINLDSQGFRLVYNQKTTYDPIMGRTVNEYVANYENNKQRIYEYDDYVYTSSNVVQSFVTNGTNFNVYNDGSAIGWNNANYISGGQLHSYDLVTFPRLGKDMTLASLDELRKTRGYLEFEFTDQASSIDNNYANAFFNSGFTDSVAFIDSIAKGDEYVFRIRYRDAYEKSEDGSDLIEVGPSEATVHGMVAGYNLVKKTLSDGSIIDLKQVDINKIYLNFEGEYEIGNNLIEGGSISEDYQRYIIDKVVQTPSLKYLYRNNEDGLDYIWDPDNKIYVEYDELIYSNYLYIKATAQLSMSNEELTDIGNRFGIFIYDTSDNSHYAYVEDVEIFKYVDDGSGAPIMPGNAPTAASQKIEVFYVKPENGITKNQITTYNSLADIAADLGLPEDKIVSLRNENCEKILSIEEQKSNCFNLLQSLCETFECWLDIRVEHEDNGAVKLDGNGKPIKTVIFKEYIGKDNFSGFRYGINLQSIRRSIDSSEFVTKLIVGQPASEYISSGVLSITEAKSNPSKESYIINLNYYLNQGLIENRQACVSDLNRFNLTIAELNQQLENLNQSYRQASAALTSIGSNRDVYVEMYEAAVNDYAKALEEFEQVVGMSYDAYREKEGGDASILENQGISDIIGRIYSSSTVLNNYSGLITNIKAEYDNLNLLVNGAETYNAVISTVEPQEEQEGLTKLTLSSYIEGFECAFMDENGQHLVNFSSGVNQKDFTSTTVYAKMRLKSVPAHYKLEYVVDGEVVIFDDPTTISFDIRSEVDGGLSKRFRLVPDETIADNIGYKKQIEELQKQKQEITDRFNSKYSRFLLEGTWESTNYIDSELYYLDAVEVSNTSAQPKLSYEIKVAEISEIEGYENYSFDVGDKTYIEDTEFFGYTVETVAGVDFKTPIHEEVVVSEVEWHLDEPQENIIVVQNYKTQFEDLFQRISATVQSLNYNQASYTRAASILDVNGRIKAGILARSLNAAAGNQSYDLISDGIIQVVEDGILVQDLTSMGNSLIIKSGGISLSTDGGITWIKALSPEGINANVINAGIINTSQIMIMDGDNPTFRWDRTGLNAYGYGNDGYDLTTYVRFDKFGLYGIKEGGDYVCTSLNEIKDKAHFGVTWDGFFIKNNYTNGYVSITSDNDFQVVRNINGVDTEKIKIGALEFGGVGEPTKYGIRIQNDAGVSVMETGDDGNLTITGTINAAAGNIGGMAVNNNRLQMNTIVLEPFRGIYSTNTINGTEEPVFLISDEDGSVVFNQAKIRGEINATSGNFDGNVTVGKKYTTEEQPYIILNGEEAIIQTSNYTDGAASGWMINGLGDAVFNNVSVRGAIKTAVFEYSEIQAVGGAFLFRPSSTIKEAENIEIYTKTTDESVVPGKKYYQNTIQEYILTTDIEIDYSKTYYKVNEEEDIYRLTEDLEVAAGKTYYIRSGAGTVEDPYVYEEVEEPREEFLSSYYEYVEIGDYIVVETPIVSELPNYYERVWVEIEGYFYVSHPTNENINLYYELTRKIKMVVEQPLLFRESEWCKISNYVNSEVTTIDATGLAYVCQIESIDEDGAIILSDIAEELSLQVYNMPGGALISFGKIDNSSNYGIGINSSDNFVNLPRRSISLFDSIIRPNNTVKVEYNYHGILGTLPELSYQGSTAKVSQLYNDYLKNTQGIFTDNMYIGDANQYLAFYTEGNSKKLKVRADTIEFGSAEEGYTDVSDGNIDVVITSDKGVIFKDNIGVILTCTVYQYGQDITPDSGFQWFKNGVAISGATSRTLSLVTNFDSTVMYSCEVEI